MKKFFLSALLILPLTLSADTDIFQRFFGGQHNDFSAAVQQTTDGGYIVAGQTDSFGNGSAHYPDAWILRLDPTGGTVWERFYGDAGKGDGAQAVLQTADDGFIVAGSTTSFGVSYPRMWICKLDADGGTIWNRVIDGPVVSSAYSIQTTVDGGYIIAGKGSENIIKLNGEGIREWSLRAGWIMQDVAQTSDGGYIAVGDSIYEQQEWDYLPSVSIVRLDADGRPLWRSPLGPHFTGTAYAVQETSDGGFIIAGDSIHVVSEYEHTHYLMMLKLNAEGSRVWTHYDSAYTSAKSLRLTTDGSAVAAGDAIDAEHGLDVLVLKLDADGSEQWRKTFGSPGGWEYASHIDQTSDGGYMIAGQTESWGAGLYDIWLIKLDRNGNGPGPVSVDPSDVSSPDGFRILPNVPNPFEQSTMIRFTLAQSRFVTVTIHDLRGRKLATVLRAQQPAGETAVPWDAGGLPVGVYLYRVQAGSVVRCGRMVLRK